MQYRPYQVDSIQAVFDYFVTNTGNPIVAMPTGTGKSLSIAGLIHSIMTHYPHQRLMVLTHVKELIEQDFAALMKVWPTAPAGINSSGLNRRDTKLPIIFGGIGSIVGNPAAFGHRDILLIDECHLVSPKNDTSYLKFIGAMLKINRNLKVVGYTATPYRLGSGMLTDGGIFTDVCYDLTSLKEFNKLVTDGYLAPLITKRTTMQYETDKVDIRGGEFVQKQLQQAVDKNELTLAACKEIIHFGQDRKQWLIFTTGIDHTENTVGIFDGLGVESFGVHSKIKKTKRTELIEEFKRGNINVLVNPNILTTGFDSPEIDLIASLRPTVSPGLWVQMLGRGTRPVFAPGFDLETKVGRFEAMSLSQKQNCLVLDFCGNTPRLGPINDPIIPKKRSGKKGTAPVRLCDVCGSYVHASLKVCPDCGNLFPVVEKIRAKAGVEEVMVSDAPKPVIEIFKVTRVEYRKHPKKDRPPTLQVTYWCGLRMFREWVCLEHSGFARHRSRAWWRLRSSAQPPETIDEAKGLINTLATPLHIKVWINKKLPEVTDYDFGRSENGDCKAG